MIATVFVVIISFLHIREHAEEFPRRNPGIPRVEMFELAVGARIQNHTHTHLPSSSSSLSSLCRMHSHSFDNISSMCIRLQILLFEKAILTAYETVFCYWLHSVERPMSNIASFSKMHCLFNKLQLTRIKVLVMNIDSRFEHTYLNLHFEHIHIAETLLCAKH